MMSFYVEYNHANRYVLLFLYGLNGVAYFFFFGLKTWCEILSHMHLI